MASRGSPVHGAVDQFLRSIGLRGLFGSSSSRRTDNAPKSRAKPRPGPASFSKKRGNSSRNATTSQRIGSKLVVDSKSGRKAYDYGKEPKVKGGNLRLR